MFSPDDYDFELPTEQIAQAPASERSAARMFVLAEAGAAVSTHSRVGALEAVLDGVAEARGQRPLIVVNDSRVVPARIHVFRATGGRVELLVVDPAALGPGARVRAWARGARRLREGEVLRLPGAHGETALLELRYLGAEGEGEAADSRARVFEIVRGQLLDALEAVGELPLPPYIARPEGPDAADRERYQTLYARHRGSVAAPTAGLHFDAAMLERLEVAPITLHVGPGTFLPMDTEDVRAHRVGSERYSISEASAARIEAARAEGRPILAVGTTATRTLESVALANGGAIVPGSGRTELVITPGYRFSVVDLLLTNFHLPRSSLLMLVCCLGGRERVLAAYAEAVAAGYRFYSYGDCMLVERSG
ncbi:S-adenosylmethionine:tRNA ribosyltransferase-isomerase [Plesiocystis pacifica SIR-1]|uniref:S-adenosylmethionine:tRNA ribosyltransferase-isomerase n=1 Tax=Plesiocystis pacifica SIR-1 TaxID=391625 RepID=A6G9V5_9BACT|nr:tRNA preQ1(34) S-adenosylmethionine ribosyltransferase-isomerase QueA [Plesiocystis pacifica]EDM77391.1 S-adenosylmethionine:tRNA ribosyltransferase-isomerase [Plesiocystis pacifica SIR-1]